MTLKNILKRLIPMQWQRTGQDEPLSMVLLLREFRLFSVEELRLAAERAWRTSFLGTEPGSKHCVVQSGTTTLMKAGPHGLNFLYSRAPYFGNPKENVDWLPHPSQRQAWANHSAYVAIDYLNEGMSVELGYAVLAKLVSEMLDGNCTESIFPENAA